MEIVFYLLLAAFLILLNAFFVLAEFAAVKARPTQMEALASKGNRRAKTMQHVQAHLDEFLSVCQIGITLASIGLGFVGEPAFAQLIKPAVQWLGAGATTDVAAHSIAVIIAYVLVSFLHIVIGELIPKSLAIRRTEPSALFTAYPLRVFYYIFIVPLWVLNSSVNLALRAAHIPPRGQEPKISDDEIRIILDQSQSGGAMSFRQLLFIENVLDMGVLTVRNAMRPRKSVCCLSASASWEATHGIIKSVRYSRYPLIGDDPDKPLGYVHVKDLLLAGCSPTASCNLRSLVRPCLAVKDSDPLYPLLAMMQRRGNHIALVYNAANQWSGFITLEDVIEELTGTIEEEFPIETPVYLSDYLSPERIILDVEGDSIVEAVKCAFAHLATTALPLSLPKILAGIEEREKIVSSYVGRNLAMPHARFKDLEKPFVAIARMRNPIPAPLSGESVKMLFILLTPSDTPRLHQIFIARFAEMLDSEFFEDRLHEATTPSELYDAIRIAEQASID